MVGPPVEIFPKECCVAGSVGAGIVALSAVLRKGATRRKQSASAVVNVHGSQPKGTNATVPGVMERKHEFAAIHFLVSLGEKPPNILCNCFMEEPAATTAATFIMITLSEPFRHA